MKVVVAVDDAGFRLKDNLAGFLQIYGHDVKCLETNAETAINCPEFSGALEVTLLETR
jgi:ribose 5-phosphate isomerase RpiB